MDAPVYRHADARATLLGLNFPGDFLRQLGSASLFRPVPPARAREFVEPPDSLQS